MYPMCPNLLAYHLHCTKAVYLYPVLFIFRYDYDYGQPRVIPETATASSRTATKLSDTPGRAAAFARRKSAATAPNAVSRQYTRAGGLVGQSAARQNADVFGTGTVFVPPSEFLGWLQFCSLYAEVENVTSTCKLASACCLKSAATPQVETLVKHASFSRLLIM